MNSVLNLIDRRWPELTRRLPAVLPANPDGRLLWQGVTMVSPLQPERESRRLVQQAFPDGLPARVVLLGHGNGVLEKVLLDGGVDRLCVLVPDIDYLAAALAAWQVPELLTDPRLELLAPDQPAVIQPGDALMEIPAIVRAFPRFCATRRVELGRLRSADKRLRILVVEPLSGGSLPVAEQAARAFAGLGHTVKSVSFAGMQQAHDTLNGVVSRHLQGRKLLQGFEDLLGQMVLLEAARFRPDFVFALAQSPVNARVSDELRAMGARTAFWFVEDCDTMPYWKALHGHFDLFLTIQKGRFQKELAAMASSPVRYLPLCADPAVHFPEPFPDGSRPALSFVGAGYHNRETAFLELRDQDLQIWGSDWNPAHPCYDMVRDGGRRTTGELNRRIFSSSRINLNLHSSTYHAGVDPDGDFVNPRVFDILACGGFQLVDHRSLLPELFTDGRHLVCYRTIAELRDRIAHWRTRPEEAAAIAAEGRREVLARHTFSIRMAECLELASQLAEDWFPLAAPRQAAEVAGEGDPELAGWLTTLPAEVEHTVDGIAAHIRGTEGELGETERLFLYMSRIQEWARSKKIDQMLEAAPRG